MTDITEVRRKAFEKWARWEGVASWPHPKNPKIYYCGAAQKAWEAWNMALDSVVIKLPTIHRDGDEGYNNAIEHCREAIEAAGVKYE